MTPEQRGYSSRDTADIVGITYRQLDYWARTDLIRPSLADARGSGSQRRYSYRDLIELRIIKTLLDTGCPLARVRTAIDHLQATEEDYATAASIVITGDTAILVRTRDELLDLDNRYSGRGVLNLLSLDGIVDQVDAEIIAVANRRSWRNPA